MCPNTGRHTHTHIHRYSTSGPLRAETFSTYKQCLPSAPPKHTYTYISPVLSQPPPLPVIPCKCGGARGALFCLWPSPWLITVIAGRCRGAPWRWLFTDLCGRKNSMGNGREKKAFFQWWFPPLSTSRTGCAQCGEARDSCCLKSLSLCQSAWMPRDIWFSSCGNTVALFF